jgi:hypothetical protein
MPEFPRMPRYDSTTQHGDDDVNVLFSRRIVIGYVFAAKKMNTMSVVMAEASKVPLYYSRRTGHICVSPLVVGSVVNGDLEDPGGGGSSNSSNRSNSSTTSSTLSAQDVSDEYIPIRVSFVPLDLGMSSHHRSPSLWE